MTEMIGSPMSGRSTPRSMIEAEHDRADERQRQGHIEGEVHLEDRGPRDVGPEQHQLPRPEVDHARSLEDQHEAQRHQRVDAADGDSR